MNLLFQAGLKNGMFMGKAKQMCPNLVTIPYDFEGYNAVSRQLYDTVARLVSFIYQTGGGGSFNLCGLRYPDFPITFL